MFFLSKDSKMLVFISAKSTYLSMIAAFVCIVCGFIKIILFEVVAGKVAVGLALFLRVSGLYESR